MNCIKTTFLTALLAVTSPFATSGIINFDNYAAGTIIDNEYSLSNGVTFNGVNVARNADNLAVIFDTNNVTGGDSDLAAPFFNNSNLGDLSPGNVLIIHENPSSCNAFTCTNPDDEGSRPAGYFNIDFSEAVTLNSIDFFDIESKETNSNTLVSLFDINGDEISPNTFYTPFTGGDNQWERLDFGISGIYSMQINLHGSGAIDNISYSNTKILVPEPATLAIFALGLIGLSTRRFQKS